MVVIIYLVKAIDGGKIYLYRYLHNNIAMGKTMVNMFMNKNIFILGL